MGASYQAVMIKQVEKSFEMDIPNLKATFQKIQDQDRHENGHNYSGGIGMADGLIVESHKTFATTSQADDYLMLRAEKWEAAIAVRIVGDNPFWYVAAWCSE